MEKYESIFIVDTDPWYNFTINEKLKSELAQYYSIILSKECIRKYSVELIHRIIDNEKIDLVIIPLMAGAVLGKSAIEIFFYEKNIPTIFMPISRHPDVSFSFDLQKEKKETMNKYTQYLKGFDKNIEFIINEKLHQRTEDIGILILDEAHDEGNIMYIITNYFKNKMKEKYHISVKFCYACLVNENNGNLNYSPNSIRKKTDLNYWVIEAENNTRNLSHLNALLNVKDTNICKNKLMQIWTDNKENESVLNMFPYPKLFRHERNISSSKLMNIRMLLSETCMVSKNIKEREEFFKNYF